MNHDLYNEDYIKKFLSDCSEQSQTILKTSIMGMRIRESLGQENSPFNKVMTFEVNKHLPRQLFLGDDLIICDKPEVDGVLIGDAIIEPSGIDMTDIWTAVNNKDIKLLDDMVEKSISRLALRIKQRIRRSKSKLYLYSIVVTNDRINPMSPNIPEPMFEIRMLEVKPKRNKKK